MKTSFIMLILILLLGCQNITLKKQRDIAAAQANIKLGLAYLNLRDTGKAKQKLLFAKEISPNYPAIWYTLGYFYQKTQEISEAAYCYQHALKLAPENGSAHNNYGAFLYSTQQYRKAIQQFLLALKDPNYLDPGYAYENAGLCALKLEDKKLAMYYFKKARMCRN